MLKINNSTYTIIIHYRKSQTFTFKIVNLKKHLYNYIFLETLMTTLLCCISVSLTGIQHKSSPNIVY